MKSPFKGLAVAAALAAGIAFQAPAQAQQGGWNNGPRGEQGQRMDPAQRLNRRVQMLTDRLHLSRAQAGQVRTILQRQDQQMQQFRANHGQRQQGADDAQRRQGFEQMRQLRQQTDQQIARVLNASQQAEYRKMQQERQQWGGRDGRDGGQRPGGQGRGNGWR